MSWEDKAACKGQPRELFSYGDSRTKDLRQSVATFCVSCPVRVECRDSASWDDWHWTVRGRLPRAYAETAGKISENGSIPLLYQGICSSGKHAIMSKDDLTMGSRGNMMCSRCRKDSSRKRSLLHDTVEE